MLVSYFYGIPLSDMERQIGLSNEAISSRLAIIEKLQVKLLKRNFGVILPEKLVITSEFPIINYQIWKKGFKLIVRKIVWRNGKFYHF